MTMLPLLFIFIIANSANADSSVSAISSGKDSGEAMVAALKNVVPKNIKADPNLLRAVLINEILPNAAHFITSYKILDGSTSSYTNLESTVDIGVIQSLFALTPKNVSGTEENAKVLLVFQGTKLPQLESLNASNYYAPLKAAVSESFRRRKFVYAEKNDEFSQMNGEDPLSSDVLRSIGKKENAALAFGVTVASESEENENSHADEEHIVLQDTLVDVTSGAVLAKQSSYFLFPKTRKDQQLAEFEHLLQDNARDLVLLTLIHAGQHFQTSEKQDFIVLEIKFPPSAALMAKFKAGLQSNREIKSIAEYRVKRGSYSYAVQTSLEPAALIKKMKSMKWDDLDLQIEPASTSPNTVTVQIKAKATPAVSVEKEQNENQ